MIATSFLNLLLPNLTGIADGRKRDAACPLAAVESEEDVCFREFPPHFHTPIPVLNHRLLRSGVHLRFGTGELANFSVERRSQLQGERLAKLTGGGVMRGS